ncbi:unnamed protein product, partial [Amoebophrya sp. A120]|eukprot:GSA120T00009668001.1
MLVLACFERHQLRSVFRSGRGASCSRAQQVSYGSYAETSDELEAIDDEVLEANGFFPLANADSGAGGSETETERISCFLEISTAHIAALLEATVHLDSDFVAGLQKSAATHSSSQRT